MKLDLFSIGNFDDIQKIEARIRSEWDDGVLNFYKKISPEAKISISSQNKLAGSSKKKIQYWFNIINEQNYLIGVFSIIGDKIIIGDVGESKKHSDRT